MEMFEHAIAAASESRYEDMLINYYNAVMTLGKGMRTLSEPEIQFLLRVMQDRRHKIASALRMARR